MSDKDHDEKTNPPKGIMLSIFKLFAKIGAVAYGGGPSMVPVFKAEVVERQNWLSNEEFMNIIAISNALPGPLVTKAALAVGYMKSGLRGGLLALLGIIIPSAFGVVALMSFVNLVKDNPIVESMLAGIRPVVVAMLAYAAWDMAPGNIKSLSTVSIAIAALLLLLFSPLHPALIVVLGAICGLALKL